MQPFSALNTQLKLSACPPSREQAGKYLQNYLKEFEGIECNSPKSCIRNVHSVMLWNEDKTVQALEMIDDRNLTSHTYHEEVANNIYSKLNDYYQLMDNLLSRTKSA